MKDKKEIEQSRRAFEDFEVIKRLRNQERRMRGTSSFRRDTDRKHCP